MSDRALLRRLRDGEDEALRLLHERHAEAVYWMTLKQVGSISDAEEITQDAFLLLWKKVQNLEIFGDSCLPWLLVTAYFIGSNVVRGHSRRQRHTEISPADHPSQANMEDEVLTRLALEKVQVVVASLSTEDQEVYRLCLVEGLSYKQAASRMRTTHPAVRSRLSRVRSLLRKRIEP